RKPDNAIYEYVVKECKVDPKESLFIDDRIKNLIPAEKLGFKTILFDRDSNNEYSDNYIRINKFSEIIRLIEKIDKIN
ncbi:MAG: HAD-IA family hydrolase, partial [Clostridia bacterium]|nr:HAD-IA family hydrolase [Clostridia bacterium]